MNKGDLIPDLLGYDAEGNAVERSSFEGTPLIIYFYPKDNTPGCTAEACSIRDDESALRALGYEISASAATARPATADSPRNMDLDSCC